MVQPPLLSSASFISLLSLCITVCVVGSCKDTEGSRKPPPRAASRPQVGLRVTRIDLGRAIDADNRVRSPIVTFKPSDTIYASIVTEGVLPGAALSVRWTFENGQVVGESSQQIAATSPAVTEFHVSKPDGWRKGKYAIQVVANGKPAGLVEFAVAD